LVGTLFWQNRYTAVVFFVHDVHVVVACSDFFGAGGGRGSWMELVHNKRDGVELVSMK
jgi:hypothetical protein